MADADDDARLGEPRRSGCGVTVSAATVVSRFGSVPAGREQRREVGLVHRPDQRRVVRALARDAQMRAFEVEAEEAADALRGRCAAGGDGRGGLLAACR